MHLLIDGDDTLWENNVHFERAAEDFIDFLAHSRLSREQVRAALDEVERANIAVRGYGSRAFAANLRETYVALAERQISPDDLDRVMALGRRILEQPLELIAGVQETVAYLARSHDLTLVTKGQREEQQVKVEASGLAAHFNHVEIVPEKDAAAYRDLVERHGFDPDRTWMIGNSPRSDVNPAVAAGLRAVFIPHPMTWSLEHEPVDDHPRILRLEKFSDLRHHF